jgi:diaminobutyrate acetyltransferase
MNSRTSPDACAQTRPSLNLRPPRAADGCRVFEAVSCWGGLDRNSAYAYLLLCDRFAGQSVVAEHDGRLVGFVLGIQFPDTPGTLFVWQVGVAPELRGQGLAGRLIDAALAGCPGAPRTLEAHVGTSNSASERLFRGVALRHGGRFEAREDYPSGWFPPGHDAEQLIRIELAHIRSDP